MKPFLLLASAALVVICQPAAAQPPTNDNATVTGAAETPLRELNVVKDKAPPILEDAKANPYAHVAPSDCVAMRHQIADLTALLGPDLDDANFDQRQGSIVADAVHSAVNLPFGSVIGRLTGAAKEKADRDQAILAGYTRRAYLKGTLVACEQGKAVAASGQPHDGPDVAIAPPRDDRPLTARDAAVDTAIESRDLPPPANGPVYIPPSDAPAVRPLPN